MTAVKDTLKTVQVDISDLHPSLYNLRKWSEDASEQLKQSIQSFGLVDPILVNGAEARRNIVIGGHFRLKIAKDLGFKQVPIVYVDIADELKEKELNLRLNKNLGDWDYELLKEFDADLLAGVGFSSIELDDIFIEPPENDGTFDLKRELDKLDIKEITAHKPLITKALYDQIHLGRVDYKGIKGKKHFPFKAILVCGRCGSSITAEEKFKLLKDGTYKRHVYYSCAKGKNRGCSQPYINEADLTHQLLQYIRLENKIEISTELARSAMEYRDIVAHLSDKYSLEEDTSDPLVLYTEYVLGSDNASLIKRFVEGIDQKFNLENKVLTKI